MGVRVDQSGNNFFPLGVDHIVRRVGQYRRLAERENFTVADRDIGLDKSPRGPNVAPFNEQVHFVHEWRFSLRLCWRSLIYDPSLALSNLRRATPPHAWLDWVNLKLFAPLEAIAPSERKFII